MTHPYYHAEKSAKLYGGKPEDYLPIHNWFDATKELFADFRHRALRHHSQGIFEAEREFGTYITNSDGKKIPVRYVGEQHVREDCGGRIPTISDWFRNIKPEPWMSWGYDLTEEDLKMQQKAPDKPVVGPKLNIYRPGKEDSGNYIDWRNKALD